MTPLAVRVLLVFAVVLGQQQPRDGNAPPRAGTAVLSGMVVTNEKDAQPIRRARITLNGDVRSEGQVATSDDAGRFVFRGVAAGRYTLQATKPPFLPMHYGASRPERPGTPVVAAEGQTVSNLTIRMTRGAALEGRVLDQNAEPIPGTAVAAVRNVYSPQTGERILTVVTTVVTDDRGVYRTFGLAPGEYIVLARPIVGSDGREAGPQTRRLTSADVDRVLQFAKAPQSARAMPGAAVIWSPVYYPGTPEVGGAGRITLGPGEERSGLDIIMRLVPTSRISGIVTTPPGVSPSAVRLSISPAGAQVRLITESVYVGMVRDPVTEARLSSGVGFVTTARPAADGSYSFVGVPAGSYIVKARYGLAGVSRSDFNYAPTLWASASVTVQGGDLDVPLALQPSIPVSGRVDLKTVAGASPPAIAGMRLTLRVGDAGPGSSDQGWAEVTDRGTFVFDGLVPESYRFTFARRAGPELFPTSLTIRGREMLDGPIEISAPVDDMTVVFTDRPNEVTGTLEDATGRPATDYFIVIFSTNKHYWTAPSRRVTQTRAGSDGKYVLRNLPAGEYFLAALTDLAPGDTSDPAYLAEMAAKAAKITVSDGATTVQSFRIGG